MQGILNYRLLTGIGVAVCLTLLLPGNVLADSDAGNVLQVMGRATLTTPQGNIRKIKKGAKLQSSDIVSTSARSYVRLKMVDSSYIIVRPDSRMKIDEFKFNKKKPAKNRSFLSLLKGGFRAVTGLITNKKKYRYRTPVATIGIRGTDFSVRVCNSDCYDIDPVPANGLFLYMHSKEGIIYTKAGEYRFTEGQSAYVAGSDSPAVLLDGIPDVFEQSPIPSPETDCQQ